MGSASLVPLDDLSNGDLLAWRQLADAAVEPNPFFDPDFVIPAANSLEKRRNEVMLLVAKAGTEWIGCVPVRRYRRWHRVPLPCLATWRHPYCLLGTPLVAPENEGEAIGAMVSALQAGGGSGLCALEWISATGRLREAVKEALPEKTLVFEDFQRATIERRAAGDYLDGWVKSKDRRELRRRSRLLGKELGGEPILKDRSDDPRAIEDFLAMEGAGWKGEAGTALMSDPAHAEFFRKAVSAFARRSALNLVFLEVNGVEVAATCDLVGGDTDFCFKVAYDEDLSRFGPGRDLSVRMIDHFHGDPRLRMMDSCTDPRNDLYNRTWRNRREIQTFVFPGKGLAAALLLPLVRAAVGVRNRRRH